MTKFIAIGLGGIVAGLVIAGLLGGGPMLSGVYNQVENTFREGLKAGTSNQFIVQNDGDVTTTGDVSISGGQLEVPTSSTATSSVTVGCVDTYATSSATQIKMIFNSVATSSSLTSDTVRGFVLWAYGSCS